jgi:hypothetical protein
VVWEPQADMNVWGALATVVLAVHLTWIVWAIFGWLVARNRPLLRWFHFGSLIYGIFIEIAPWPCPLTLLEHWLESKAGAAVYREPFLVHYLEAVVYPDVPERVLVSVAVAVCMVNLYLHLKRLLRR